MVRSLLSAAILFLLAFVACNPLDRQEVVIETDLGTFQLELYSDKAPVTARNFLALAKEGVYTNAMFYRTVRMDNQPLNTVKIEVIQGGLLEDSIIERYTPIPHEPTSITGIRHTDGVISMARNQPGTASTEFFICIGDQPSLDEGGLRNPDGAGFAAFGRVTLGMEVVRSIQAMQDSAQMLLTPVRIKEVYLIPRRNGK